VCVARPQFDPTAVTIPAVDSSTARFMGVPLMPPFRIAVLPTKLQARAVATLQRCPALGHLVKTASVPCELVVALAAERDLLTRLVGHAGVCGQEYRHRRAGVHRGVCAHGRAAVQGAPQPPALRRRLKHESPLPQNGAVVLREGCMSLELLCLRSVPCCSALGRPIRHLNRVLLGDGAAGGVRAAARWPPCQLLTCCGVGGAGRRPR